MSRVVDTLLEAVRKVTERKEGIGALRQLAQPPKPLPEQEFNKRVNETLKSLDELETIVQDFIYMELKVKSAAFQKERAMEQKAKADETLALAEKLEEKFRVKFEEKQKQSRQFQKVQEEERKKMIDAYQQKVQTIKKQFEDSVRRKEQQIKLSEQLRQQCDRQQTDTLANEAIKEAQFKKKQLQNFLEEATLKQRVDIMQKYREINVEMVQKIRTAKETKTKVKRRVDALEQYEQIYKEAMDEFYVCVDGYKTEIEHYRKFIQRGKKQNMALENKLKGNEATLVTLAKEQQAFQTARKEAENQNSILRKIMAELQ